MRRDGSLFRDFENFQESRLKISITEEEWNRITEEFYKRLKFPLRIKLECQLEFDPKYVVSLGFSPEPYLYINTISRVYVNINKDGSIYFYRETGKKTRLLDPLEFYFLQGILEEKLYEFLKEYIATSSKYLKRILKEYFVRRLKNE